MEGKNPYVLRGKTFNIGPRYKPIEYLGEGSYGEVIFCL